MGDYQRICLIHYHEIGLKGHNRAAFEMRLLRNLEHLLRDFPLVTIHRLPGRLLVFLKEGTDYATSLAVVEVAKRVPGVARVSCGYKCERALEALSDAAVCALHDVDGFTTFKVSARRNHTDFPIHSMDMNREIGSACCDAFPEAVVKMVDPDVTVGVEVVQNAGYVHAASVPGIGGLPVGSSGKVVCLLSSGIDSPVALWRIARRGAVPIAVHFSGRPQTESSSEYLCDDIAHVLEKSGCIKRMYIVPFGDYQKEIALVAPADLRIILYRRLMMKVAERIAHREKAGALVTGESLGQVASQTLDNLRATDQAVEMPVLRPLIGTDKLEIIAMAQQLGTFEISSQPAADCCTLFMPRSPETHAKMPAVLEAEAMYPWEAWIDRIMDELEVTDYSYPKR